MRLTIDSGHTLGECMRIKYNSRYRINCRFKLINIDVRCFAVVPTVYIGNFLYLW